MEKKAVFPLYVKPNPIEMDDSSDYDTDRKAEVKAEKKAKKKVEDDHRKFLNM